MKICILSSFEDSMQKNSGASVRIYNLAKSLALRGNRVEVIIPRKAPSIEEIEGVTVRGIKGFLPNQVLNILRRFISVSRSTSLYFYDFFFVFRCSRLLKTADVVQLEQQTAGALFIPFIKFVLQKPVVVDCHDIFQAVRVENSSLLRRFLETTLEYIAYKFANLILVVSERERAVLGLFGVTTKNVRIIPNGVDTNFFGNSRNTTLAGNGFAGSSPIVVFVGNLKYYPNRSAIEILSSSIAPKVVKSNQNVKFLVVGDNSGIARLPNLVFAGLVESVPEILKISDIAVAPLFKGTGTRLKILEYLSSGLPVVSTTMGAEGLEVTNGVDIIIADDLDKFSMEIIRLLEDKKMRERIGRAARRVAESKYDWVAVGEKLEKVIEEMLITERFRENAFYLF